MVCTLHKNKFRPFKCSNFHWYEEKLQISSQTCFWLWEEVVSLEPMNQNLPFNDLTLKVGKIHISVALNRTSNCRRTNFTFDTSFHNKSGYKQKNVQSQKRHGALPPDCHWQELVLYLMEVLDLHSILILRTPVLIGHDDVYN